MRTWVVVGLFVLAAAGCTGSVEFSFGGQTAAEAAVDLIESDEMSQRLMLPPITGAACEEPLAEEAGTTFPCTGTSGDTEVDFEVLIEPDDRIFASPTNVVPQNLFVQYEEGAVEALNAQNDFTLASDAMDCGSQSVILDDSREMSCVLTDGDSQFEAVITVDNIDGGSFNVRIVDVIE